MAEKILIEMCPETTWKVSNFMGDSETSVGVNYETSCELVGKLATNFSRTELVNELRDTR